MKPVINNNGDRVSTLIEENVVVYKALLATEKAMQDMTVHGRNYQCNHAPVTDLGDDCDERFAQFTKLQEIKQWLTEYTDHLYNEQARVER